MVVRGVDVAWGSCCWACCRSSNRLRCGVGKDLYDRLLCDHVCPCRFYVVEVEVVVAGCASYGPLVAGGHRTDHHFHSSDHRRTRADVGVGEKERSKFANHKKHEKKNKNVKATETKHIQSCRLL